MTCYICGKDTGTKQVSANKMRQAIAKGFNPIALGLASSRGMPVNQAFQVWKELFLDDGDSSDWEICSGCMSKLSPYL